MTERFEEGHYYAYKGPTDSCPKGWNERMCFCFDGEPHLCLRVVSFSPESAIFDGQDEPRTWDWSVNMEYWEEVFPQEEKSGDVCTKIIFRKGVRNG